MIQSLSDMKSNPPSGYMSITSAIFPKEKDGLSEYEYSSRYVPYLFYSRTTHIRLTYGSLYSPLQSCAVYSQSITLGEATTMYGFIPCSSSPATFLLCSYTSMIGYPICYFSFLSRSSMLWKDSRCQDIVGNWCANVFQMKLRRRFFALYTTLSYCSYWFRLCISMDFHGRYSFRFSC